MLDYVLVCATDLAAAPDESVLAWAAQENRVLLTHDVRTVPPLAYARIATGQPMPGVLLIPANAPLGRAIVDCLLYIEASTPEDVMNRVIRLPFPL